MACAITAVVLLLTVAGQTAHAEDGISIPEDIALAAEKASVDPVDLLGAMVTTGMDPTEYLYATGELKRPTPPVVFGPNVDARAWCVEGIESRHGEAMYNPIDVYGVMNGKGPHAQGYLGWLPGTAASVGVTIGNRASEWAGFRRMLAAGRGNEYHGIRVGIC